MVRRIATHHTLELVKGARAPNLVDMQLEFDPTELGLISGGIVFEGRTVFPSATGWKLGTGDRDKAFFLLNNTDDLDVKNDGGDPETEADAWSAGTPSGVLNAVCCIDGHELATTEFKTALTYGVGDYLYAPVSTGVAATMLSDSGVLTNVDAEPYRQNTVGTVSRARNAATAKNAHGRDELYFLTHFLPKIGNIPEPTWG